MHLETDPDAGRAALIGVLRHEWPRVLASLVRTTGSLQLAEDALQDAVVRALDAWTLAGVPPEPRAWLTVTARRRALDLLRRESRRVDKETAATLLQNQTDDELVGESELRDDLLRLLFTCCHPALPTEAQTALALRTLCGLTTAEVANALLVSEPTMAKRLVRAKRKIAVAGIPYTTAKAEDLPRRLQAVLTTIYLLFNEGYHATSGEGAIRLQLTTEAIRLVALVRELLPDQVAVVGLEALLRLHNARSPARLDAAGDLVRLPEQNRAVWDVDEIRQGLLLLGVALRQSAEEPNLYVVQAAIAACHDLAPKWEATNWAAIVSWYDVLFALTGSPVVRLNRAVAVGELYGADAALAELEQIADLGSYLPFATARAEILGRTGRLEEALAAFRQAATLPANDAARRNLSRRMSELS